MDNVCPSVDHVYTVQNILSELLQTVILNRIEAVSWQLLAEPARLCQVMVLGSLKRGYYLVSRTFQPQSDSTSALQLTLKRLPDGAALLNDLTRQLFQFF